MAKVNTNSLTNSTLNTELATQSTANNAKSSVNIDFVDKRKSELMKKYHLKEDQYNEILIKYPDFPSFDVKRQDEIIEETFNPTGPDKKTSTVDECISEELAKNIYTMGFKGNPNAGIPSVQPNSLKKSWNSLSDVERQNFTDKLKSQIQDIISNNDFFKNIIGDIKGKGQKTQARAANTILRAIQVANANNMSVQDFAKLDIYETQDLTYKYLSDQKDKNLNHDDQSFIKLYEGQKDYLIEQLKSKHNINISPNASLNEIAKLAKDYLINVNGYIIETFNNKQNKTEEEKQILEYFNKLFNLPAGKDVVRKVEIANVLELQKDYNELVQLKQSGTKLSAEQEARLQRLERTLNTKEAKDLLKDADRIYKPQTDEEKAIVQEWNEFNKTLQSQVKDPHFIFEAQKQWLEKRLGELPEDKRYQFISTIIKCDTTYSSVGLLAHFTKQEAYEGLLQEKYLISENSLNADKYNNHQWRIFTSANIKFAEEAEKNGDTYTLGILHNSSITANTILKSDKCSGPEHDDKKKTNAEYNSKLAQYYGKEQADEILNSTTDVNATITDAEKQMQAQQYVQSSSAYNADVADYAVQKASTNSSATKSNSPQVDNAKQEYANLIQNAKQGNIPAAEVQKILDTLSYEDRKEFLSVLSPDELRNLPVKLCDNFPELIPELVNAGKGLEIISYCDMPSGNTAISIMMQKNEARKELAAVRPERFAQYTQYLLEQMGIIKGKNPNIQPLRRNC